MSFTAIAAVAHQADKDFVLEEVTLDDLRPNELQVKIEAVGICHTDATLKTMMPLPAVFGHEGVGIVEKTGSEVDSVQPGDRVVISYPHCGTCPHCENHRPALCDNFLPLAMSGARLDGSATIFLKGQPITGACFSQSSFATHAITTENNVVKVSREEPHPEKFAALPCGVITGAGTVFNSLNMSAGQSIAVFGAGTVGLAAIMAAHALGASHIIAVDVVEKRLELAKQLGATHVVDGKSDNVVEQIKAVTGRGTDYVFDTTGNVKAFHNAMGSAKKGGTLALVIMPNISGSFEFTGGAFMNQALHMVSIQQGDSVTREFIPRLIAMNEAGKFPYEKLITYYKFDEINKAFEDSHKGDTIKPVLVMP